MFCPCSQPGGEQLKSSLANPVRNVEWKYSEIKCQMYWNSREGQNGGKGGGKYV
jgi:hypothetical protein